MKAPFDMRAAIAAVLCAGTPALASVTKYCPSNSPSSQVCYSVGIPSVSASTNTGNIYFQLSAPTTLQWVALGTGTGMAGSNMFIMYQDGAGNVTISPRKGTFHTEPKLDTSDTAAELELLEGSGVEGGVMTANVRCGNCESWDGGEMKLQSTGSDWIAAWKKGGSLGTTNRGATLTQHDDTATFELDLTKAVVQTDGNPFVGGSESSGSGSGDDKGGSSGQDGDGDDGDGGVTVVNANRPSATILAAHGVIMALVFAVLYPLGALLMPLLGKWWAHGAFQAVSWILMWAAFGLGIKTAQERNLLFKQAHTIFGTVVVCLLVIQPALGFAHHKYYVAHQHRGLISHVHIWWGRILMVLGVVNGGLGLQLADARNSLIIAYSVIAAILFLLYAVGKTLVSIRKKQAARVGGSRRKDESSTPNSSTPYV